MVHRFIHRITLSAFAVVFIVFAASCNGNIPRTNTDSPAAPLAVTVVFDAESGTQTVATDAGAVTDLSNINSLDDGLDKLQSYRKHVTYSLEGNNEQGQTQKMSIVLAQEIVVASQDQHVKLSTYSTVSSTTSGSVEIYQVGGLIYIYNPYNNKNQRCARLPPRLSLTSNPANLFKPGEILGLLDTTRMVKSADTVNGLTADRYSATGKDKGAAFYSTAKGDIWVARDGGFVLKYVGEATGNTTLLASGSQGTIKWDYSIEDVDKTDAIALPPECPAVQSNVNTPVATRVPVQAVAPTPVEEIPLTANATDKNTENGITTFSTPENVAVADEYYKQTLTGQGWTQNLRSSDTSFINSAYCSTPTYLAGKASLIVPQVMFIYSKGMRTLTIFLTSADNGSSVMLMDSATQ